MLFFSYSWADASEAHAAVDAFRAAGLPTWLDVNNLNINGDIESQLFNGIVRATFFLHLDTEHSRRSPWVAFERQVAALTNKVVFDVPPEKMVQVVTQLPHHNALNTEPRAARFLKTMSFAVAR